MRDKCSNGKGTDALVKQARSAGTSNVFNSCKTLVEDPEVFGQNQDEVLARHSKWRLIAGFAASTLGPCRTCEEPVFQVLL